ncbi:MAG: tRNA (adenine-N1)-methyltransferase [Nanoarchaeota archaeon]|nr:MAG: tRNA (adenine-N1)-methyltransferase [Nanoarchaeota archaeon]
MPIEKIAISSSGKTYYIRNVHEDLHTKDGFLKKDDLENAKNGTLLRSNTGVEFFVFDPALADIYKRISRGPQIIPRKDLGFIAAETGMNKESIVLDAGTGSGAAACFFGMIAKEVFTYELREDFLAIAEKNIELMGLKNIMLKLGNVYEKIEEKELDIIVLDLPEPWLAVGNAFSALKAGGFLVAYSPTTPQVQDFVIEVSKHSSLMVIKVVEISEREWEVKERKVRPKSQAIGHSGFIVIARKLSS